MSLVCKYQQEYDCCTIWCEVVQSYLPSRQCNKHCAQYIPSEKEEQYNKGKAREKRLKQLQELEERTEKQGTQKDLDRIRNFRQDLLSGKYSYCDGNAEAQKLIRNIGRQINKRKQKKKTNGKHNSDSKESSSEQSG